MKRPRLHLRLYGILLTDSDCVLDTACLIRACTVQKYSLRVVSKLSEMIISTYTFCDRNIELVETTLGHLSCGSAYPSAKYLRLLSARLHNRPSPRPAPRAPRAAPTRPMRGTGNSRTDLRAAFYDNDRHASSVCGILLRGL